MSWKIDKHAINMAARVSEFMMNLRNVDKERYDKATEHEMPFGDLAYGMALEDWIRKGKPKNAWFSYAPGQMACPLLMTFAKEISERFGLEILTTEEGEKRRKSEQAAGTIIKTKKVVDWGPN